MTPLVWAERVLVGNVDLGLGDPEGARLVLLVDGQEVASVNPGAQMVFGVEGDELVTASKAAGTPKGQVAVVRRNRSDLKVIAQGAVKLPDRTMLATSTIDPMPNLARGRTGHDLFIVRTASALNPYREDWSYADYDEANGVIELRPVAGDWPSAAMMWNDERGQAFLDNRLSSRAPRFERIERWDGVTETPAFAPEEIGWLDRQIGADGIRDLARSRQVGPVLIGYGAQTTLLVFHDGGRLVKLQVANECAHQSVVNVIKDDGRYVALCDFRRNGGPESAPARLRAITFRADGRGDHCIDDVSPAPSHTVAPAPEEFFFMDPKSPSATLLSFAQNHWIHHALHFNGPPLEDYWLMDYQP